MSKILIDAYLDYINNYLTIEVYAEHNGLSITQARSMLTIGEELHIHGDFLSDR